MKALITPSGFLHIERSGKMKPQICPMNGNKQMCGDWCPLFGEPKWEEVSVVQDIDRCTGKVATKTVKPTNATINLCKGKIIFAEPLTDDRKRGEDGV